jgi:predicted RNA-binding protein with TRAM domain
MAMAVALAVVELGRHGGGEVLIVGYAVAVDGPGTTKNLKDSVADGDGKVCVAESGD